MPSVLIPNLRRSIQRYRKVGKHSHGDRPVKVQNDFVLPDTNLRQSCAKQRLQVFVFFEAVHDYFVSSIFFGGNGTWV